MLSANVGDLAQALLLRRQTGAAAADLNRLTQEVASGRVADLQTHLRGDFSIVAGLQHSLTANAAWGASNDAAAGFAEAQQTALEAVQANVGDAATRFLTIASTGETTQFAITFADAAEALEQVVGSLNTDYAGRALFAGAATAGNAVADATQIIADLGAALAGQTTAAGALAAADAFFDMPGGGFDSLVYGGSATPLAPFDIADGKTVRLDTTAQHQAIRDSLKGLAVVALMGQGLLSGSPAEQQALLQAAGAQLTNTNDDLTERRAAIGSAQERIESARIRNEAEATGLETALAALTGADPYESATKLKEAETRIETLYTITARLSSLSLVSVLR